MIEPFVDLANARARRAWALLDLWERACCLWDGIEGLPHAANLTRALQDALCRDWPDSLSLSPAVLSAATRWQRDIRHLQEQFDGAPPGAQQLAFQAALAHAQERFDESIEHALGAVRALHADITGYVRREAGGAVADASLDVLWLMTDLLECGLEGWTTDDGEGLEVQLRVGPRIVPETYYGASYVLFHEVVCHATYALESVSFEPQAQEDPFADGWLDEVAYLLHTAWATTVELSSFGMNERLPAAYELYRKRRKIPMKGESWHRGRAAARRWRKALLKADPKNGHDVFVQSSIAWNRTGPSLADAEKLVFEIGCADEVRLRAWAEDAIINGNYMNIFDNIKN